MFGKFGTKAIAGIALVASTLAAFDNLYAGDAGVIPLMPFCQSVLAYQGTMQASTRTLPNGLVIDVTIYNLQMTSPPPFDPNLMPKWDPVTGAMIQGIPWGQNGWGFPQLLEDGTKPLRF